jgi:uncharacterized damage-inducible protein DinB
MTDAPAPAYRIETPTQGDEKAMLLGFLDYHRATLRWKCEDLTPEQLAARAVPTSTLSLLGIVRHLAEVERSWFGYLEKNRRPGIYYTDAEPDLDFDGAVADPDVVAEAWTTWQAEVDHAGDVAQRTPLDLTFTYRTGEVMSHRWTLLHMIEEYSRHNGHADLLREAIDGATGE